MRTTALLTFASLTSAALAVDAAPLAATPRAQPLPRRAADVLPGASLADAQLTADWSVERSAGRLVVRVTLASTATSGVQRVAVNGLDGLATAAGSATRPIRTAPRR